MKQFKCSIVEHENEEIIGYCLNIRCQKQPQYCYQCIIDKIHDNHILDCKRLNEIANQIQQNISMLKGQENNLRNVFEEVKCQYNKINKLLVQEIQKQQELERILTQQCFEIIKNEIGYLKIWQQYHHLEKEKSLNQTQQKSWIKNWFFKSNQPTEKSEDINYISYILNQVNQLKETLEQTKLQNIELHVNIQRQLVQNEIFVQEKEQPLIEKQQTLEQMKQPQNNNTVIYENPLQQQSSSLTNQLNLFKNQPIIKVIKNQNLHMNKGQIQLFYELDWLFHFI